MICSNGPGMFFFMNSMQETAETMAPEAKTACALLSLFSLFPLKQCHLLIAAEGFHEQLVMTRDWRDWPAPLETLKGVTLV